MVMAGPGTGPSFWTPGLASSTEIMACVSAVKQAKPPSLHHLCSMWRLGGRRLFGTATLPLSRGPKGQTHGKFVVRILLSFPEGPGMLELLHFVGPVVAGERQTRCRSLLEPLPDLTAAKSASYTDWVLPMELSQNRQSPR